MERLKPTRGIALRVWWAFIWRSLLGALGTGFVVGLALGVLSQLAGLGQGIVESLAAALGLMIGLAVSVEVMYRVLQKSFKHFEIALIAREGA